MFVYRHAWINKKVHDPRSKMSQDSDPTTDWKRTGGQGDELMAHAYDLFENCERRGPNMNIKKQITIEPSIPHVYTHMIDLVQRNDGKDSSKKSNGLK